MADFGDRGIEEVIKSGLLKRLKVLDLRHGLVTDAGARTLAACPDLTHLDHLDLGWNRLTASGVVALQLVMPHAYLRQQQKPEAEPWESFYHGDIE
jgi:hypothetical protein